MLYVKIYLKNGDEIKKERYEFYSKFLCVNFISRYLEEYKDSVRKIKIKIGF